MPQNSKHEKAKIISVVQLKDDENLNGKQKFETQQPEEHKPYDGKKKRYKREAKSACELRRNPRYEKKDLYKANYKLIVLQ
jgi:hypothetical protein